jgi:hypothetical protein
MPKELQWPLVRHDAAAAVPQPSCVQEVDLDSCKAAQPRVVSALSNEGHRLASNLSTRTDKQFAGYTVTASDILSSFGCAAASSLPLDDPNRPLEILERELDGMHDCGELFVGRFKVLSCLGRRMGGQGCVQFVRRVPDQVEYAVKFFIHADHAFQRELTLYRTPGLHRILPEVHQISPNEDGAIRSQSGYIFPPFIMVEKGESLNEWASRVAPDFATTLFLLLHIAERLQQLHEVGMCHRDVKPANVLWRPLSNSWTLIDFGCSAPIGACRYRCVLCRLASLMAHL